MAVLSSGERIAIWSDYMSSPEQGDEISITKGDLKAVVDAIDDWIDANGSSFNSAIPQPARSALSVRQKARLLMYVVRRRFELES